jgi:hypothetical protein
MGAFSALSPHWKLIENNGFSWCALGQKNALAGSRFAAKKAIRILCFRIPKTGARYRHER